MTHDSAARAMARAERARQHAAAALAAAPSPSARKRHTRRLHNAARAWAESARAFAFLTMTEA